jgi:hypothetical protein
MSLSQRLEPNPVPLASIGGIEARQDPRLRLMLRTSKLVGSTGEFFCVVRDISQGGVRLRLFHPLPEGGLALELSNGDRYPIEQVWRANGEAGFRFTRPVDVDSFIAEPTLFPKRPVRLRMVTQASLASGSLSSSVHLADISQHGAKISSGVRLETGQLVRLGLSAGQPVYARVRWANHPQYGLAFERAFRLDELAALVWDWHRAAAPFALEAAG